VTRLPFSALALLAACAGAPHTDPASEFLLAPKAQWFGVYIDGHKAGWSSTHCAPEQRDGRAVVVQSSEFQLHTQSEGADSSVRTVNEEVYAAQPPFEVLTTFASETRNGSTTVVRTERRGADLRVSGDDGRAERWLTGADYGLGDAHAVELWLRAGAHPGDRTMVRTLDLNNTRIGRDELRFVATRTAVVAGVTRTWHEFERTGPEEGTFERERVAPDCTTISWTLGAMELRAEPEAQARQLDAPLDLDLLGRVHCDQPLGEHQNVHRLVVRAEGRGTVLLANGPGQEVSREPGGLALVTVAPSTPGPVPRVEELREALSDTRRYPCRDERVQALARHATGMTAEPRARVQQLLIFVAAFIEDSYTDCDHPSVFAIMDKRTGDCSDHALLFTTLARALGIPARTVLGVAYQGDATQAFGPHEWCEVVLDGHWVPVDPTFAQLPADAARLRLGPDASVSAAVADFTLRVVQIER